MQRKLIFALFPVLVCAGTVPAQAAPFAVQGSVTSACTILTNPGAMGLAASPSGNGANFNITSSQSWNWSARCNGRSQMTIGATSLRKSPANASVTGNNTQVINYTVQVKNWTSSNSTDNVVTTADDRTGSLTSYSGVLSKNAAGTGAFTVQTTGYTKAGGTNATFVNGSYVSTITLTLSGVP